MPVLAQHDLRAGERWNLEAPVKEDVGVFIPNIARSE